MIDVHGVRGNVDSRTYMCMGSRCLKIPGRGEMMAMDGAPWGVPDTKTILWCEKSKLLCIQRLYNRSEGKYSNPMHTIILRC